MSLFRTVMKIKTLLTSSIKLLAHYFTFGGPRFGFFVVAFGARVVIGGARVVCLGGGGGGARVVGTVGGAQKKNGLNKGGSVMKIGMIWGAGVVGGGRGAGVVGGSSGCSVFSPKSKSLHSPPSLSQFVIISIRMEET